MTAEYMAGPQVISLDQVKPERVEWLWPGYLPLGKLVTLDGDPGLGKSTIALDIAARMSAGTEMPDGSPGLKGTTLVLSAEDGLADTIRPRLDAAGARPQHVITITEIVSYNEDGDRYARPVTLPGDLPAIERTVAAYGVKLIIVDVLMAYLSERVNAHRDQDVRRALHPLAAMAQRTGCCVLVLRHLNKHPGASPLYRGGGSIGIVGASRAALIVGTDPADDSGSNRVLACAKSNLARVPPSLLYQLLPSHRHGSVFIRWAGACDLTARDLVADQPADERTELDEARDWLAGYLEENGDCKGAQVKKAARADGIAERTLHRARLALGVTAKRAGFQQPAVWSLPQSRPVVPSPGSGTTDTTEGEGP